MFEVEIDPLDAAGALAYAADLRSLADQAEGRLIAVAAHYADLHGALDQAAGPLPGMERLVRLGGPGTPEVAEFAAAEFGAELAISTAAAVKLIADALDLRHRLPRLWRRVQAGEVKPWIARHFAQTTRLLPVDTARTVDDRVSRWAHNRSCGQLDKLIEAVVIKADPPAAEAAAEQAAAAQGVWVGPSNDHGIKDIHIRTTAPAAIWFDATVDRIADTLQAAGDTRSKDARRGAAVGIIADPQRALDLIVGTSGAASSVDSRPPATLYVHLSQESLTRDEGGVARLEGVGPVTIGQAREFLEHCAVTVRPVIDLADQAPVDAYETPERLRDAVHLRSPVDVFPYASGSSRRHDLDHTEPYLDPGTGGPPGQTRLDNLAPMTRMHHRIKTHGRWRVQQPTSGVFVWTSPHGRTYQVDHTGTTRLPSPRSSLPLSHFSTPGLVGSAGYFTNAQNSLPSGSAHTVQWISSS